MDITTLAEVTMSKIQVIFVLVTVIMLALLSQYQCSLWTCMCQNSNRWQHIMLTEDIRLAVLPPNTFYVEYYLSTVTKLPVLAQQVTD